MIGRRGFLASLAALVAAPFLPTPAAPTGPALAFHPDAFSLVSQPFVNSFDVIYGFATLRPELACRFYDDSKSSGSLKTYFEQDAIIQERIRAAGAFVEKPA